MKSLNNNFIVLTTQRTGSSMFLDSLNSLTGVEGHMELFLDQFREKPAMAGKNDYLRFIESRDQLSIIRPFATWKYLNRQKN